jgi:hypothetical protein
MISENSSVGLSRLLWTMSDICKDSDSTRVVGKCQEFFDTLLWVRMCIEMDKYEGCPYSSWTSLIKTAS